MFTKVHVVLQKSEKDIDQIRSHICPWFGGRVVYGADSSSLATYGVIHILHIPMSYLLVMVYISNICFVSLFPHVYAILFPC